MSGTVFVNYNSSTFDTDPIFNKTKFKVYRNSPSHNASHLFVVEGYRYVLICPDDFRHNKELCFKVATYLYHHIAMEDTGELYTYFFGDINKCKEIGDDFENQICKYISYEMIEEWYPKSLTEINDKFVNFFLAQQKHYGQEFELKDYDMNYLLFIPKRLNSDAFAQSRKFLFSQMENCGYYTATKSDNFYLSIVLTDKAIVKFQKTKSKEDNTAFIAIKFKDNEERIKAIQDAIAECGYTPVIMTEYQTNDWIMPEIFHQIQLCKFVVVDLSLRCDGAYYEAGYAHAMGKQVIHIYDKREENNNPLHFDVAQKSTVIYKDYEDMKEKLKKRIEATIN